MDEEGSAESVPEEQATDWLPMSEELAAEEEQVGQDAGLIEGPAVSAGELPSEPTAMDWLSPAQGEPAPLEETPAAGEGIPEWLAPEAAEAAGESAGTPVPSDLEAEGSEWLFEAVPPEPQQPPVSEPAEPAAAIPSEPDWMRPAAEPEPGAEPPRPEAGIPEWLREPVEPPSMRLPEDVVAGGPVEPITFEIQPETPVSEPIAPEEPAEPAIPPVALQPEQAAVPEVPVQPPAPLDEVPAPKPRAAARVKQAVRPDQLLASARESLASGDVEAAALAYAKLVKKRSSVDEVISDLHGALERAPNMPALWQVLGDAYMRANMTADAIEAYRRGLSSI